MYQEVERPQTPPRERCVGAPVVIPTQNLNLPERFCAQWWVAPVDTLITHIFNSGP